MDQGSVVWCFPCFSIVQDTTLVILYQRVLCALSTVYVRHILTIFTILALVSDQFHRLGAQQLQYQHL